MKTSSLSYDPLDESDQDRDELLRRVLDRFRQLGQPKEYAAFRGFSADDLADLLDQLADAEVKPDPRYQEAPPLAHGGTNRPRQKPRGQAIKLGVGAFSMVPVDAIMDPRLAHSDVRLLGLLLTLSGAKGYCWWSERRLAETIPGAGGKIGVGLSTIERGIRSLAACGYIEIVEPDSLARYGMIHRTPGNTYVVDPLKFA